MLSKEGLSLRNIFITYGRFTCITYCSENINKRFRKTPSGTITTFVEQATNRAVLTKKICLYSSPIFNIARGEAINSLTITFNFFSLRIQVQKLFNNQKQECSGPHRICLWMVTYTSHFFSQLISVFLLVSKQDPQPANTSKAKMLKHSEEILIFDLSKPHSKVQRTRNRL